jgi:hypothetical protein
MPIYTQGREAVQTFVQVMSRMLDAVEGVRDPQSMARKLTHYAEGVDKTFNELQARVEAGDKSAELDMQQHLLNNELGDGACVRVCRVCRVGERVGGFGRSISIDGMD